MLYSTGVTILPDAPPTGTITVATLADNHQDIHVEMTFDFDAAGVTSSDMGMSYSLFVAMATEEEGRRHVTEWLDAAGWSGDAGTGMVG